MTQFTRWRDGGGLADIHALSRALTKVGNADSAAAASSQSPASLTRLGTAAAGLQAAAQTMQADPPPACVPNLRGDSEAAQADLARSAQGQLDTVQAEQNGDIETALSHMNAANGAMKSGLRAIRKADRDISSFTGG